MHPRKANHLYKKLRPVKPLYFFVGAVIFLIISVYGLRHNNLTMLKLSKAVTAADQQNGDVETALQNLRKYVYTHMNTDLASSQNGIRPPVQLKARYERLSSAEQVRVKAENDRIAAEGTALCGERFPAAGYNAPRVACLQDYVAAHAIKPQTIPEGLYKFDFLSPRWSPDLAGISLVLSAFFAGLGILWFIILFWLKRQI